MERARVIEVQRIHTLVRTPTGEVLPATVRGEFHQTGEYPKVGDYVKISRVTASEEVQAVIESIEPRTSVITRLDQETLQPQVLVANVDLMCIVMGLDGDYNLKRLERYLLLARQSNIKAVILLNKADLASDIDTMITAVTDIAGDVPVYVVIATTGDGLEQLSAHISSDTTAVLLGSSGAGKSTITNWLLGEEAQDTQDVRVDDSRGRHTTTTRQLFVLPQCGYLIDTPGMRELGIVEAEVSTDDALIAQVEELALQCKFNNCDHDKSVGCAVLAALEAGELPAASLDNYYKLLRERAWQQDRVHGQGKKRYAEQTKKRSQQANAAIKRKRLARGL